MWRISLLSINTRVTAENGNNLKPQGRVLKVSTAVRKISRPGLSIMRVLLTLRRDSAWNYSNSEKRKKLFSQTMKTDFIIVVVRFLHRIASHREEKVADYTFLLRWNFIHSFHNRKREERKIFYDFSSHRTQRDIINDVSISLRLKRQRRRQNKFYAIWLLIASCKYNFWGSFHKRQIDDSTHKPLHTHTRLTSN